MVMSCDVLGGYRGSGLALSKPDFASHETHRQGMAGSCSGLGVGTSSRDLFQTSAAVEMPCFLEAESFKRTKRRQARPGSFLALSPRNTRLGR